jgi:hypothetical protein
VSEAESSSTVSTSVRAIGSISGKTEMSELFYLATERNAVSKGISKPPISYGESTRHVKHGRTRWF